MLILFILIGYLVAFNKKLQNTINKYILWIYKIISNITSTLHIKKYISIPKFITMAELIEIEEKNIDGNSCFQTLTLKLYARYLCLSQVFCLYFIFKLLILKTIVIHKVLWFRLTNRTQ